MHRRAAGGLEFGRAWEARRARPSQEDSAAAPARRTSRTSTWRPGATRGGLSGSVGPPRDWRVRTVFTFAVCLPGMGWVSPLPKACARPRILPAARVRHVRCSPLVKPMHCWFSVYDALSHMQHWVHQVSYQLESKTDLSQA